MKAFWWWVAAAGIGLLATACSKNIASKPEREPVCPTTMVSAYVDILNFDRTAENQLTIYEKEKPSLKLTADEVLMKCMEFEENFAGKSCQASIDDRLQTIRAKDVRPVCDQIKTEAAKRLDEEKTEEEKEGSEESESTYEEVRPEDAMTLEEMDPYHLWVGVLDEGLIREQLRSPLHGQPTAERLLNGGKVIQRGMETFMTSETFMADEGFCFFSLTPDQEIFEERAIYVPRSYSSGVAKTGQLEISGEIYNMTTLEYAPYATVISCLRKGETPLQLGEIKQIFGGEVIRFYYDSYYGGP